MTAHTVFPPSVTRDTVRAAGWANQCDQPLQDNDQLRIEVRTDQTYQTWAGLGGALSELGWDALNALPEAERERFFAQTFGPDGLRLAWVRIPVGANDFSRDAYSLADSPEDFALDSFDLARDETGLLPFLDAARQHQPRLKVHASPWSPPAWMKVSGKMADSADCALREGPEIRRAYAAYLRRFLQAYGQRGHGIDRLMVQNEMDSPAGFPGCRWDPDDFARFHVDYLLPELRTHGVDVELWAGTFRGMTGLQAHAFFAHDDARAAVAGAGFQYCSPQLIRDLQLLYPGLRVMHTETVCHRGLNTPDQAVTQFDDFIAHANAGCDVFTYWNLVLNENPKSTWDWAQNSVFTAHAAQQTLRPNPDHAVLQLIADHLQPGAVRVAAFSFLAPVTAFRNPDGRVVVFMRNLEAAREVEVTLDGVTHDLPLPGHAACALLP